MRAARSPAPPLGVAQATPHGAAARAAAATRRCAVFRGDLSHARKTGLEQARRHVERGMTEPVLKGRGLRCK